MMSVREWNIGLITHGTNELVKQRIDHIISNARYDEYNENILREEIKAASSQGTISKMYILLVVYRYLLWYSVRCGKR